ncbi:UvrB/UvrC motif-containing protein [Hathewaya massiliensis]|uniref:UvrB/UvrC motif-containing protein n=1 Tax=Hathewaya massiliensis TaxID=1964382 RepID=UPI00115A5CEA|nr:UvrB/UvrC motif-containing protein [Hathewaya massiliensis]
MICERCKQNQANVHIAKIINGQKEEQNLCDKCAKELNIMGFTNELEFDTPFSFPSLLGGIVDYISKSQLNDEDHNEELVCKNCGTSYIEFKNQGLLGCSKCYDDFSSYLLPVVKRVQGNTEHSGKIPVCSGKDIYNKRLIVKLREELQRAVNLEEYEKAAELRDKIKELKKEE